MLHNEPDIYDSSDMYKSAVFVVFSVFKEFKIREISVERMKEYINTAYEGIKRYNDVESAESFFAGLVLAHIATGLVISQKK